MADIFLSHSSRDNDTADKIKNWLERDRGSWSVFLDRDKHAGILAGQAWQDRLRIELQSCRLVLAIITPDWLSSRWCFTEAIAATFRGKDFVGVLPRDLPEGALDVAPPIVHERQRQLLDLSNGNGWEELLHALDESGLDPSHWFSIPKGVGPYPGFVAFEEKDAGVFFGRDQEITDYLNELTLLKAPDRSQALVISGGSGSGKSSLLRAGLIPRLRRQPDWLVVSPFDTRREPIHALFAELRKVAQATGADVFLPSPPPQMVTLLIDVLQNSLRTIEERANAWLILPIDQAEVLLEGSGDKTEIDAHQLLLAIGGLLESRKRKLIPVFTIRTEFMPALLSALPNVRIKDLPLGPMRALTPVIEKPAERFGIELEKGLAGHMIEDTRGADALPLLAYILRELNENYGDDKKLTLAGYNALGGVEGAIEKKLREALSDPEPTDNELAAFRRCFVRQLVRVDETAVEGERHLRWPVPINLISEDAQPIVRRLRQVRLLVDSGEGTISLAHDRLIRDWGQQLPLRQWLLEDRVDGRLLQNLLRYLDDYEEGGPLLSQKPLRDAEDLLERDPTLESDEPKLWNFIRRSREQVQESIRREEALRQEEERAKWERQQAVKVSESLRLASAAREAVTVEPETALLAAWEALMLNRNELSDSVFREALNRTPAVVRILLRSTRHSRNLAVGYVSEGGCCYAVHRDDGDVNVWNENGMPTGGFSVSGQGPMSVLSLTALGKIISCRDGLARLHEQDGEIVCERSLSLPEGSSDTVGESELVVSASGRLLVRLGQHAWTLDVYPQDLQVVGYLDFVARADMTRLSEIDQRRHFPWTNIFSATINSDGDRIMTQGGDSTMRTWYVDGDPLATMRHPEGMGFASGQFLKSGIIVTGTMGDGSGHLWDDQGNLVKTFRSGDATDLFVIAVTPDGAHFATADNHGEGNAVEVWNSEGDLVSRLTGHEAHVWSGAFSYDGRYLATGSADRTVRVWDWDAGHQLFALHGHTATVDFVAFHPSNEAELLSKDQDGSLRQWKLNEPILVPLKGHRQQIRRMFTTSVGVLTSDAGLTSRFWNNEELIGLMRGEVVAIADASGITPASAITVDNDRIATLWSLPQRIGAKPRVNCEIDLSSVGWDNDAVSRAAIAPNRSQLVLASDFQAQLWSAKGQQIARLEAASDPGVEEESIRLAGIGFRPDSNKIVTAARNGTVWIWKNNGSLDTRFVADHASPDRIFDLAIDPKGKFIAVAVRNRVGLWGWDGALLGELRTVGYKVFVVKISPNGSHIISIADNPNGSPNFFAELWSRNCAHVAMLDTLEVHVSSKILFGAGARFFCVASARTAQIFDFKGQQIGTLGSAQGIWIQDVKLAPDGNSVAAAFSDGRIRIWNASERRRVASLEVGPVEQIAFSPNGRRLFGALSSGLIEQYALDVADLFAKAAHRVDRQLTRDEVDRFAVPLPLRVDLDKMRASDQGGRRD